MVVRIFDVVNVQPPLLPAVNTPMAIPLQRFLARMAKV
jgi:hypothetical protein